jgi:hypothetical protein
MNENMKIWRRRSMPRRGFLGLQQEEGEKEGSH